MAAQDMSLLTDVTSQQQSVGEAGASSGGLLHPAAWVLEIDGAGKFQQEAAAAGKALGLSPPSLPTYL